MTSDSQIEDLNQASNIAADYVNAYFTHLSRKETRPKLAALYRETSTVTYGDIQLIGIDEILQFLQALPLESLDFKIADLKVCPSSGKGVLVLVVGESWLNDKPLEKIIEAFYLDKAENGDFYIASQILTLLNTPTEDIPAEPRIGHSDL